MLSQAYFIIPSDRIIQLTLKPMYNEVTKQNLKMCVCAIIIKVFALIKKSQKHSNLKN